MAEQLEPRAMLAGDVDVFVGGSTLFVRGDSRDNQVAIAQIDDGVYAVVGLNGTTVNGRGDEDDDGPVFVSNRFVRNVDVSLSRGNDVLAIGNDVEGLVDEFAALAFLAEDGFELDTSSLEAQLDEGDAPEDFQLDGFLRVAMADGNDAAAIIANGDGGIGGFVSIDLGAGTNGFSSNAQTDLIGSLEGNRASIGASLVIRAGSGADQVNIRETDIESSLIVSVGDGNNDIDLGNCNIEGVVTFSTGRHKDSYNVFNSEIDRNLVINSGSGDDGVVLKSVEVDGLLTVNTGAGSDIAAVQLASAETLNVNGGTGIDGIRIIAVAVVQSAVIDAGSGNDSSEEELDDFGISAGVFLTELDVGSALTVNLGSGRDTLDADGVLVDGNALIVGGAGDDIVEIEESQAELFVANLGSGRDDLVIVSSAAERIGVNGGAGTDTLETDFDEDDEAILFVISFESRIFGDQGDV